MNRRNFCLLSGGTLPLLATRALGKIPTSPFAKDKLARIDEAVLAAIKAEHIPGAVVWVECGGMAYHKAYGLRQKVPATQPMLRSTIFDMASLTKVMATTMAVMKLVELKKLHLSDLVSKFIPAFTGDGRQAITLHQLLTHTSGLRPGIGRDPDWTGYTTGIARACSEPIKGPAGENFVYSDINFILLGEVVRVASGQRIDQFLRKHIFDPLGMYNTFFVPGSKIRHRIAPTTMEPTGLVHGVVHDPTSRRMDGLTGHAGLFSTAEDLAKLARMLLAGGGKIFKPTTVQQMTQVQTGDLADKRGYGWDIDTRYSEVRGTVYPAGTSYGHTGWTGTSVWIDPGSKSFVILLTNRNHPTEQGATRDLRIQVATLAAEACGLKPAGAFGDIGNRGAQGKLTVSLGVDVLAEAPGAWLNGRFGLVTNHTGLTKTGQRTIEVLARHGKDSFASLFSPEHGLAGKVAAGDKVGDATDERTGLPIYSLYGEHKRPSAEQLKGLDTLFFDIQDIGCRFYTYISTLLECQIACAEHGVKLIVLDRPNPLGGTFFGGPMLHGKPSFVACHSLPLVHGMTVGELAKMFAAERKLKLDLEIVPLRGWSRDALGSATDLAWVNPSPNIRSLDAALLYPGTGLFERTNVSVGRGTQAPFLTLGAPWIDGEQWAAAFKKEGIDGVRVKPIQFTPSSSTHAEKSCGGLVLSIDDASAINAPRLGLGLLRSLLQLYGAKFELTKVNELLFHPPSLQLLLERTPWPEIERTWAAELTAFAKRRSKYLLY